LARLEEFLTRHRRIGLDSNVLIYFIERHRTYHGLARRIFEAIESGRNSGVCSTLTLLEVLVQPYRKDDDDLANQFYALLTTYPHLTFASLSIEIADLGARLRAKYRLKTPDAILVATAIQSGATGYLGNDSRLKNLTEIEALILGA
jgi:predicted nucleic acid-binding protein